MAGNGTEGRRRKAERQDTAASTSFLFGEARVCGETGVVETAKLTELLRGAKRMLLFTGAGISTGSGIPDFRGPEGVWKRRQPVYYQDFMRSGLAFPPSYHQD